MSELIQTHETRHVDDLQAHEFNREIYNTNATDLIDRIEDQGYEDTFGRITIKPDGTILSGHRRWKAAQAAGIEELPVEVVEPETEREERRLILLANEYRDKTPAEKIREADAWEEFYQDPDNSDQLDSNVNSRTKAAEKVGVGEGTISRGKQIKEKADKGDEKAQEEWEKLESGKQSIHGAHKEVKKNENKTDDKSKNKDPREQHTELSLVRVLEDGACIYTSGGDTYLVPKDQLPE
jgi:hypothetical protein